MNSYQILGPLLRLLNPEQAHDLTLWAMARGLAPRVASENDPLLSIDLWGRSFRNPIGLAAGFDKNAAVVGPALGLGFGFVEIGSVTPRPQPGNPKPRIFRLSEDRGVINRLGFNNLGVEAAARNLRKWRAAPLPGLLGVNLGKNKDTGEAVTDYLAGAAALGGFADYLVINVSSPNTPGLRALQGRAEVDRLISAVQAALQENFAEKAPPLILKVAPDLTEDDRQDIAQVALERDLDGLTVSNTTITRPESLTADDRSETGGLSGRPLFDLSTRVLGDFYRLTGGRIPLIGVGGVGSGADAYAKIRAGASLVQLYSALVYEGPDLVELIKRELARLLRRDGFETLKDAVGAAHR
ncbi:quinone-dependent dihydroorotate dehydrogenase [Denitrobaculum tricleocarpae]|uniref:Dihydroorotate dehydrogenase (quinone) n=1 Tax=Denitrobaculum tricleocarpae TaxID=2591009 RepID=A0A545T7U7_9PROT|nr:quinone-dependent dihydroorotate dehydrogenase [Denitrobaculum tricleocarpae]TQV73303.1 quinone-dependent dihydroorotate dehydrogenase [Denitrobaculum tricleocarpae]